MREKAKNLEQVSHFRRMRQAAMCSDVLLKRGAAQPGGKRLRAGRDPEAFQKYALRRQFRAGTGRGGKQSFKVHMRGQVSFAG